MDKDFVIYGVRDFVNLLTELYEKRIVLEVELGKAFRSAVESCNSEESDNLQVVSDVLALPAPEAEEPASCENVTRHLMKVKELISKGSPGELRLLRKELEAQLGDCAGSLRARLNDDLYAAKNESVRALSRVNAAQATRIAELEDALGWFVHNTRAWATHTEDCRLSTGQHTDICSTKHKLLTKIAELLGVKAL